MMYVYRRVERGLLTVGFYAPDGTWHSDKDFSDPEEAADRVRYLNGGNTDTTKVNKRLLDACLAAEREMRRLRDVLLPHYIGKIREPDVQVLSTLSGAIGGHAAKPEDTRWLSLVWDNGAEAVALPEKGSGPVPHGTSPLEGLQRVRLTEVRVGTHYVPAVWFGDVCAVPACMVPDWQDLPVYGEEK